MNQIVLHYAENVCKPLSWKQEKKSQLLGRFFHLFQENYILKLSNALFKLSDLQHIRDPVKMEHGSSLIKKRRQDKLWFMQKREFTDVRLFNGQTLLPSQFPEPSP